MKKILILLIVMFLVGACSNNKTEVNEVNEKLVTEEANNEIIEITDSTELEADLDREIIIAYRDIQDVNYEDEDIKLLFEKINQIRNFELDLVELIMDEMNINPSYMVLNTDEDVLTSLQRGDSNMTFGYDVGISNDGLKSSYSYLNTKIDSTVKNINIHNAFIVNKDEEDLLNVVNDGILRIKENGKYQELYSEHFGDDNSMSILK